MKLASLTTHKREADDQETQKKRGTPRDGKAKTQTKPGMGKKRVKPFRELYRHNKLASEIKYYQLSLSTMYFMRSSLNLPLIQ
jgi:hypothetical protein